MDVDQYVSLPRLMALVDALASYGARPDGGVDRQALTAPDIAARVFLTRYARELGCQVTRDSAGNMFFRREGTSARPPIATGSHIDTQPAGGKLDGAYGVCAGLEAVAALNDARLVTQFPVDVVLWANEEGCRFAPGSLGSKAYADPSSLEQLCAARDASGATYADGLLEMDSALNDVPLVPLGRPLSHFIEAHIEQGPVLESRDIPIGIVVGVQGVRWFRVLATGESAHAGTTPLTHRRDALRALAPLLETLYAIAERDEQLRITIGSINVSPSSINTVPERASITVDVRHVDAGPLDLVESTLQEWCSQPRHKCHVACEQLMKLPATSFDPVVTNALRNSARAFGFKSLDMTSGAFHDAVQVAALCPTGMLFVPSRGGVSHNPTEYTDPDLLVGGARVLVRTIAQLAHANHP